MLFKALVLLGATSVFGFSFQYPFAAKDHAVGQADVPSATLPGPPMRLPHPPMLLDLSDQTIAQILKKSLDQGPSEPPSGPKFPPPRGPPHVLPLYKLAKALDFSKADELKAKLADEKANVTFIAPDDIALTPPHRHEPHHHEGPPRRHHEPGHRGSFQPNPLHSREVLQAMHEDSFESAESNDTDRKEFFRKVTGYVLDYHLIPEAGFHPHELADFSTVASFLNETRIHIEPRLIPEPALVFNFYAKTVGIVVKAKNGWMYLVNAPLLPPLPPLGSLFIIPSVFSTLTSGVQKVGLDLHTFHHEEKTDDVHPVVHEVLNELVLELPDAKHFTIFAPTNHAFQKLGWELNAFLFSPFGRRILKAVLSYHVIPDVVFFSDFNVNATISDFGIEDMPEDDTHPSEGLFEAGLVHAKPLSWLRRKVSPPRAVKVTSYSLKTAFNETTLPVDVYEYRTGIFRRGPLRRAVWVGKGQGNKPGSRVKVVAKDVPAFKGAIQVVDSLIRPPFPEHHEHEHHEARVLHRCH